MLCSLVCPFQKHLWPPVYLLSPDHHEPTPRLEDFFWTGSGDGPPPPPDVPFPAPLEPSTPVVKTTTVLATVYLDSYPSQVEVFAVEK